MSHLLPSSHPLPRCTADTEPAAGVEPAPSIFFFFYSHDQSAPCREITSGRIDPAPWSDATRSVRADGRLRCCLIIQSPARRSGSCPPFRLSRFISLVPETLKERGWPADGLPPPPQSCQSHGSALGETSGLLCPITPSPLPKKMPWGARGGCQGEEDLRRGGCPLPSPPRLISSVCSAAECFQVAKKNRRMHKEVPWASRCPSGKDVTGVWRRAKGEGSGFPSEGVGVKGKGFICSHRASEQQRDGISHPTFTPQRREKSREKPLSGFINRSAFLTTKGQKKNNPLPLRCWGRARPRRQLRRCPNSGLRLQRRGRCCSLSLADGVWDPSKNLIFFLSCFDQTTQPGDTRGGCFPGCPTAPPGTRHAFVFGMSPSTRHRHSPAFHFQGAANRFPPRSAPSAFADTQPPHRSGAVPITQPAAERPSPVLCRQPRHGVQKHTKLG